MNKDDDTSKEKMNLKDRIDIFNKSLSNQNDRAVAVMIICWFDKFLEELIRNILLNDNKVNELFEDGYGPLNTFSNKLKMAYFTGLIPKFLYHDMTIINKIRNRFAHEPEENLTFNDKKIKDQINSCKLRGKTLDGIDVPKVRLVIVSVQINVFLLVLTMIASSNKPKKIIDIVNMDKMNYEKFALTKDELIEIVQREITGKKK